MKYTRLEIYKGISNSKLRVILNFFIIIPIIAVLCGSIITKIFIPDKKNIQADNIEDKPTITVDQMKKLNYNVLFLQAGAFMNKNNADALVNSIKTDDIFPVVIQDGDVFRVIVQISDSSDRITKEKDKLNSLGFNCLVNVIKFSSIEYSDSKDLILANNMINTTTNIIKHGIKINENFNAADLNSLEDFNKYCLDMNNNYEKLKEVSTSSTLETFKSSFDKFSRDYISAFEKKELINCKKSIGQMVLLLNGYYTELIQKYSN